MAIEIIRLNLIPDGKVPVVHCKQYDVDRAFKVCIYEGDKPYIFTDETVELNVRKSDTTLVTTDLDITSGVHCLVVHTTEQMCAVVGKNECEIRVIKEGANIGSLNFIMEIKKSPTEGGLHSDSEINNLRRQMKDIIDPVLDEMVPPVVEELVPQVIGDDYYNKTEINTIVEGIDTALESIGHDIGGINDDIDNLETELGNKADANEVAEALEGKADKETTYTKEEVDDIVYNILPDDTASGSVANFETDLALPIKSLEIDVNAKQDLHGYDYPWTAGGGKNILKTNGLSLVPPSNTAFYNTTKRTFAPNSFCLGLTSNNYYQGNKVTQYLVEENNISVTSSANAYAVIIPITNLNIGETYTLSASSSQGKMSVGFWEEDGTFISNTQEVTSGVLSFTVPQNTFYVGLSFNPRTNDIQATFTNIQLEKGSTATTYAPYENICPIEGWSEIGLVHCGKNLFNDTKWFTDNGYTLQSDGSWYKNTTPLNAVLWSNTSGYSGQIYIRFQYKYVSEKVGFRIRIVYTDDTVTEVYTSATTTYTVREVVSTSGKTVKEIKTTYGMNIGSYIKDFSINQTDYNYEPYNGNTEVINLGGTYYGGHFTQDKAGHRQFRVTHGIKPFGDISFSRSNNGGAWSSYLFYSRITDKVNGGVIKCSNYDYVDNQTTSSIQNEKIIAPAISNFVYIRDDAYTTVADFKTANANTQLVYPLATPIIIDLPDGEPIITLNGTNNIYADTGDTCVVFKDSVNGYVERNTASVQALALNT